MLYFLLLFFLSFEVFADLLSDSSLFPDDSGAGELSPVSLSNDEWLT